MRFNFNQIKLHLDLKTKMYCGLPLNEVPAIVFFLQASFSLGDSASNHVSCPRVTIFNALHLWSSCVVSLACSSDLNYKHFTLSSSTSHKRCCFCSSQKIGEKTDNHLKFQFSLREVTRIQDFLQNQEFVFGDCR